MKKKKSIFILGDKHPNNCHQNLKLKKIFDGMLVKGNYYGG